MKTILLIVTALVTARVNCGAIGFPVASRGFNARSLPGLTQWYQPSNVDGSSNPYDQSGAGRNGTQANVTIIGGQIHGRSVLRFNGTSSHITYPFITTGTSFYAFSVVKNTSGNDGTFWQWSLGATNRQVLFTVAGPKLGLYDGVVVPESGNITSPTSAFSIIGVVCTAGTPVFYQNGVSQGTGTGGVASFLLNDFGTVTVTSWSTMDNAQMFFGTSSLSADQITMLTTWLKSFYGL